MLGNVQDLLANMNKKHKLALEDYLYVFGGVSEKVINVRLLNIDPRCMTILFNHKDIEYDIEKAIIFEPPLEDRSEAVARLNYMAHEAAAKRQLAHFQINDMAYPESVMEYLIILAVFLPIACYKFRSLLYWLPIPLNVRQSLDNDTVLKTIILLEFLTHLVETLFFLKPKLLFYRVTPDFLIEWYLFGMLEGFAPLKRLKRMAARAESTADIQS
ncbi:hypothetical protein ZYGM_000970 [Zygosaccharomyces mellis]|uniref:DUF2470 domain-containing protein n=1 Tax=Zygosaccharomyces mellis TaxID=42258 RepID=A0A4C2E2X6_9SACH|nr:hypothetical protein ZYGM_000970 [Zygosaccharomyces mellis]